MQDHSRNIYKIPRMKANLTQEMAAELIPVSVESVRAYETGQTTPPDDIVCRMAIVYDAPHLALQHLMNRSEAARRCLPVVEIKSLTHAIISLQRKLKNAQARLDRLVEIGDDGKVTEDEAEEFTAICEELSALAGASLAVRYAKEE